MPTDPRDTLRGYVRVQTAADRKVLALLRQAKRDVERQLKVIVGDGPGALVARDQARATRAALNARMAALLREVGQVVAAAKLEAALEADRRMLDYDAVLMAAVADETVVKAYLNSARLTSTTAIENAERRLFGAGYRTLSEKVYRTGVVTSGLLDSTINSALARGLSAHDFAKEVVGFVDPATPGGASYAAMRLARTEVNNAHHARSIDDARERPWVYGMLWTLSSSHPHPDECDDYAAHDDGHGVGVYAVDDVPEKPHPLDLCVVTQVDQGSWDNPKTGKGAPQPGKEPTDDRSDEDVWLDHFFAGDYDDYIDGRVAAAKAADRSRK